MFGRHLFVGGNTLIPAILRDNAKELNSPASKEAFDATIAATKDQLQKRTGRVTLGKLAYSNGSLTVPVKAQVFTGHKFPTGHPTRRAWLRVVVKDKDGKVWLAVTNPAELNQTYALAGANGVIEKMTGALKGLTAKALEK